MKKWNYLFVLLLVLSGNLSCQGFDESSSDGFLIKKVDQELYRRMMESNVFGDHSPVPIDRLRLIELKYFDFDGNEKSGEIMVLDACSPQVMNIFQELYRLKFPMQKVELLANYKGSDSLSMADNNTSAHNLRQITGGSRMSLHAYGTAIDLNPIQNPYVGISCDEDQGLAVYEPAAGIKYANRMEDRLGKKNRKGMAEEVLGVFSSNGFYWWGGYWNCPIDYQHFEVSRSVTDLLVQMKPDEAKLFFEQLTTYFNNHKQSFEDALKAKIGKDISLKEYYKQDPKGFLEMAGEFD